MCQFSIFTGSKKEINTWSLYQLKLSTMKLFILWNTDLYIITMSTFDKLSKWQMWTCWPSFHKYGRLLLKDYNYSEISQKFSATAIDMTVPTWPNCVTDFPGILSNLVSDMFYRVEILSAHRPFHDHNLHPSKKIVCSKLYGVCCCQA